MPSFRYCKPGYVALNVTDLVRSVRHYRDLVGLTLELEIRLTLRAEDVAPTQLHSKSAHGRLGYDNFLVTRPQSQDRSEPGYCLLAA